VARFSAKPIWWILGLTLALALVPVVALLAWGDPREKPLDARVRAEQGGEYMQLAIGLTRYRLEGPRGAPVLVLVHGSANSLAVFDPLVAELARRNLNLRVLRFDLLGMGYSDHPAVRYDLDLYDRQILQLLGALDIGGRVDMLGFAEGAALAANFAVRHPQLLQSMTLVAPMGLAPLPGSHPAARLSQPVIGRYLANFAVGARARELEELESLEPGYAEYGRSELTSVRFAGTKEMLLSFYENVNFGALEGLYRAAGAAGVGTVVVLAEHDPLTPPQTRPLLQELFRGAWIETAPGTGHGGAVYDRAADLAALVARTRGERR
jgi:pimeloyl-ACP methyl ester carboxylesterase